MDGSVHFYYTNLTSVKKLKNFIMRIDIPTYRLKHKKTEGDSENYEKKKMPQYDEDFGHLAEQIIRGSIERKANLIVEKVEKGTKEEDKRRKVDFWIKFYDLEQPIGIQYTVSDNEKKIAEKKNFLKNIIHNIARKEKKPDAEINWSGNATVILVQGDKRKMVRYWKESEEKKVDPAEVVDNVFLINFFNQVRTELGSVNPALKEMLINAIAEAVKRKRG
jgi:hypothetical protein